ncbi:hypothetical protein EWU32_00805 [Enterococcus faecium]|nr:hypothetical protein EWU32_00805 [Enterococcus faecium]
MQELKTRSARHHRPKRKMVINKKAIAPLIIFTIHVKTEKKKKEGKNDDHREETESYFHADNIEFIKLCAIICNSRHYR